MRILPLERRLHYVRRMQSRYMIVMVAFAASWTGCKRHDRSGIVVGTAEAASAGKRAEAAAAQALMADEDEESGGGGKRQGSSGTGINRWKDSGVYVDGKPVGMLSFGELPIALKPVWVPQQHSIELEPGHTGPTTKMIPERRYRMIEYLKAVGVDVARIKEIQVMGPKSTQVIIASGKDLRSKKGRDFMFRFGASVGGKPIPDLPPDFGNGVKPDKMGGVMVYIDKKPPVLDPDQGLELDGKPVDGVPYFGDPVRGGVRVYDDDRLCLDIKRSLLKETPGEVGPDGQEHWKLAALLKQNGVDLSKVVELWAIADERRKQKFTRAELDALTFTLDAKQKNELLLGAAKVRANALALHSHALQPNELPQIRADEDMD